MVLGFELGQLLRLLCSLLLQLWHLGSLHLGAGQLGQGSLVLLLELLVVGLLGLAGRFEGVPVPLVLGFELGQLLRLLCSLLLGLDQFFF